MDILRKNGSKEKKKFEVKDLSGVGKQLQKLVDSQEWKEHEIQGEFNPSHYSSKLVDENGKNLVVTVTRRHGFAKVVSVGAQQGSENIDMWKIRLNDEDPRGEKKGLWIEARYLAECSLENLNEGRTKSNGEWIEKVDVSNYYGNKPRMLIFGSKPVVGDVRDVVTVTKDSFTLQDAILDVSSLVNRLEVGFMNTREN